jgi:hypothetical protein
VIKIKPNNKAEKRILGIDGYKIYNLMRSSREPEKGKSRGCSLIC